MGICDGFEFLRVPEGVLLPLILEILAEFDVVIEVLKRMLKSILEDSGVPVV